MAGNLYEVTAFRAAYATTQQGVLIQREASPRFEPCEQSMNNLPPNTGQRQFVVRAKPTKNQQDS
jgi:hypothetical protein